VQDFELHYFTHSINGKTYGGWYRLVSPGDLEVLGVGSMETVPFLGYEPEAVARSVLEEFVRRHSEHGDPDDFRLS
jgi:hypothetical protein